MQETSSILLSFGNILEISIKGLEMGKWWENTSTAAYLEPKNGNMVYKVFQVSWVNHDWRRAQKYKTLHSKIVSKKLEI